MKINKTVETPDGSVTFAGELNPDELEMVLSVGINFLLQQGALPLKIMDVPRQVNMHKGSEEVQ